MPRSFLLVLVSIMLSVSEGFAQQKGYWEGEAGIGHLSTSLNETFKRHLAASGFNLVSGGLFGGYRTGQPKSSQSPPVTFRIRRMRANGWGLEAQLTSQTSIYSAAGYGSNGFSGSPRISAELQYGQLFLSVNAVKELRMSRAWSVKLKSGPSLNRFRVGVESFYKSTSDSRFNDRDYRVGLLGEIQPTVLLGKGERGLRLSGILQYNYGPDFQYKSVDISDVSRKIIPLLALSGKALFIGFSAGLRVAGN